MGGEDDVDDDDDDDVNSIKRSVYHRLLSIDGCSQAKNMLLSNNKNIQVAS